MPAPLSSDNPSRPHRDWRNAFLCGLAVACAVLIAWPVAEVGRDDDWSYARTALELARTGRLTYNGWSTALLGAQAFWGAGVIKLLGFSFTALRLSILPFACATAAMLYLLARRVGASPAVAIMASLTIGLSQLNLLCAATFSTDIPALFCFTFTLLQIGRSFDPQRRRLREIAAPLFLAAVVGYLGGSIRQVFWLMPLLGLTYAAWVRRRERASAALTMGLMAAVFFAMLATEVWSHGQLYFIPEYLRPMAVVFFGGFPRTLLPAITLGMTLTLFSLPMILGTWATLRKAGSVPAMAIGVLSAVVAVWLLGTGALAPWLGNFVTEYGTRFRGQDVIGDQPQVIPDSVRLLLTFVCAAAATRLVWALARSTPALIGMVRDGVVPHLLCVTAFFAVPYTALILFRGPAFTMNDRYTLPLTATLVLWLAWLSALHGLTRMPAAGWSLLAIVALFGIAVVHDDFAATRAHLRAADSLTSHGILRTSITAGMDYDAWTQAQQTGYVNEARIVNPPNAFVPHPRSVPPGRTDYWYWEWTPAVRPDYFVVDTPQPDLNNLPGMIFPYRAWLPPFYRSAYVQKGPPGWSVN